MVSLRVLGRPHAANRHNEVRRPNMSGANETNDPLPVTPTATLILVKLTTLGTGKESPTPSNNSISLKNTVIIHTILIGISQC